MPGFEFYIRQMAHYAACHRDRRNRATHVIGIPTIVFALIVALSMARWQVAGAEVSLALIVALAAVGLWLTLDIVVGGVVLLLLLPVYILAEQVALNATQGVAWTVAGVAFAGGWALQFLGHALEGKKPAFLDNSFQMLIAPMYMAADLLFRFGLRQDLAARIAACVAAGRTEKNGTGS